MSDPAVARNAMQYLQEIADGRKYQTGELLGIEARELLDYIHELQAALKLQGERCQTAYCMYARPEAKETP